MKLKTFKLIYLFSLLFSNLSVFSADENLLFYQSFENGKTAIQAAGQTVGAAIADLNFESSLDGRGLIVGIWNDTLHNIKYPAEKNLDYRAGTVELWVKPVDWAGSDQKFHHFFEAQGKDIGMIIYKYKNSELYFLFGSKQKPGEKTVPWVIGSLNIKHWQPGEWHQLVCTWDKKEIKLFVDGGGITKPIINLPNCPFDSFAVGALNKWPDSEGKTLIDNLKIHQRALNIEEIKMQYQKNENSRKIAPRSLNPTDFWILDNGLVRFFIDKDRGNLTAGWNLADQGEYIINSFDEYTFKRGALVNDEITTEEKDQVVSLIQDKIENTDNPKSISIRCKNPVWGLEIIKTYELWMQDHKLIKKVEFKIDQVESGLLKYASAVNFSPEFRNGYYHVRNERDSGSPFLTKATDVTYRRKMDSSRGMSQICFINPQKQFGVGQYKYLVNNRYDLKYGLGSSDFTPDGWIIGIDGDFIGNNKMFSAEVHYAIFPGDHVRFYQDYMNLPAYQEANNYQTPKWLKDVRLVAGWNEVSEIGSKIKPDDFLNLFEKDEPVFGYVLSPWNDPMWKHYGDFLDGEIELYPYAQERIRTFKAVKNICPRLKLSCYVWQYSVGPNSKIFLNHPEWLVYNENDKPRRLFESSSYDMLNSSFRQMVSDPEYLKYACTRVKRLMTELNYDTYYMDDISISRIVVDWKTRTVVHNYHWIDYWKKIRDAVKSGGEDKVFFANSFLPDIIGPDCGLVECGSRNPWIDHKDPIRSGRKRWTAFADRLFMCKLYQYDESRWIAPIFWGHCSLANIRNNDPYFSNYLIGLGLKPMSAGEADAKFMGSTFNSLLSKLPYIDAAYETRGTRIVNTNISPCWWRDDGNIEAYTLKQGNAFLIPVISHESENIQVKLTAETEKSGLDKNSETYFWVFDMEDPWQFTKEEMLNPDWRQKSIMRKKFIGKEDKLGDKLNVTVTARPILLSMVLVTQVPALICTVNGRKAQILLPSTVDIDINGKLDYSSKKLNLKISSRKDTAEIIAYFPGAWGEPQIFSGNKKIDYQKNTEFGLEFYKFNVVKGESDFELKGNMELQK
jgi:hypothetical protein